ncbi:hypothetical protein J2X02_003468 [Pseudoxanthomonas japonensis]|uniref:hypothetical protein n=1 Tax=Pseudoxanthomonas japonensis TaxID=69284 RepID=UPI00286061EC|nr:hypothetical protein [Pseudoxanthomonas japonensis]MDR7070603.1 hypothetical protein [Pseudoxanthomonas japonensis]
MTPPRNIEAFNRVVAVTLVKLYEAFPDPISLSGPDIGAEAGAGFSDDTDEQFRLIIQTAANAIGFLVREGFIHYDPDMRTLSGPEFPDAVLTMKGLTLLGKTPDAVDESSDRRPFIEQLHDVVEEGARASATNIVVSLFSGAIRLGMSAAGVSG